MRRLSDGSAMTEARRFRTLTLGRAVGGGAGGVAMPQATAQNQMIVADATPDWTLLAAPDAEGQVPITGADPYTPVWGTTFPTTIQFNANIMFDATTSHIRMNTSDGADTKRITLCGGGGFANTRGALIWLAGNECADGPGLVHILAGNVAGGHFRIWTGAHKRVEITYAGVVSMFIADDVTPAMSIEDAGGIEYQRIVSTNAQPAVVFNEGGADVDFRIEASGEANALFLQGSTGHIGLGTDKPVRQIHVYNTVDDARGIIIDAQGATGGQHAILNLLTLGDGEKSLGNVATRGWHLSARGNAFGTSSQQNDLTLWYWDGSTYEYGQYWDHDGTVYVYENNILTRISGTKQFAWIIPNPAVGAVGQVRIPWDCTVRRVDANTQGGTSCTFNLEERGTLGSSGTNVLSSDMAADANGETVTSGFNNASLAEGNYLTIDISAVSGVVGYVNVSMTVTID